MAEKRRFYYSIFKAKIKPELYWCWLKSFQVDSSGTGHTYLENWYIYHRGGVSKKWTPNLAQEQKTWIWEFSQAREPHKYDYKKTNKLEFLLITGKTVDQAVAELVKGLRINQVEPNI